MRAFVHRGVVPGCSRSDPRPHSSPSLQRGPRNTSGRKALAGVVLVGLGVVALSACAGTGQPASGQEPVQAQQTTAGAQGTSSSTAADTPMMVQTQNESFSTIAGIWARYDDTTGTPLELGGPSGDVREEPGDGRSMPFANGTVYWSPETGAFIVRGEILRTYQELRGPGGDLGYPVDDETNGDGETRSDFQHGSIVLRGGEIRVEVR